MSNAPLPTHVPTERLVLVIQFSDRVPPALLTSFFAQEHIEYYVLHVYHAFELSQFLVRWRALIVLGGPMGAYETEAYPFLIDVKALMAAHLKMQTPTLCICLGAQLLADVIGAKAFVSTSSSPPYQKTPELGYTPMQLTAEGMNDSLLCKIRSHLEDAHFVNHHGDTFSLPPDVPVLAKSATHAQAFRFKSALAVQFHPEASASEFSVWLQNDSDERMALVGKSKHELIESADSKREAATEATQAFFNAWWSEVCTSELR